MQYKPGDVYASGRIAEIDQLLALQAKQKQFDDLVTQADNNFKSNKLDQAATLYNQAKQIVPENEYPQNQLNLINEEKEKIVKIEELEKEFAQAIDNGDNLVRQKDFLEAINAFRRALELKPNNKLAADKIAEAELAIAVIEKDKKYQETVQQADQALATNDLERAKMFYQESLKLKSAEAYPMQKLAEINVIQTNETVFIELLANAEKAAINQNYEASVSLLNQALKIKPNDQSVQKRMDEIGILQKQQLADREFDQTIQRGDQQKSLEKYEQAINIYRDALKIKPNNKLALGKISDRCRY